MKQEDKQYEKWLTEIKSNQPILENPEELTATILNRISGISPERKRRKFLIGAWASGIAASLLLLLLINDTCFTSVPHRTEMQNEYDNWSNSIPLPDNWEEMRLLERILIYPLNIYNTGNPGRCKSYKSSKKND